MQSLANAKIVLVKMIKANRPGCKMQSGENTANDFIKKLLGHGSMGGDP